MIDFNTLIKFEIPKQVPCIYFLFYKDILVYIGQTTSLYARLVSHNSDKEYDRCMYMPCDKEKLNDTERALIKHYLPIYNGGASLHRHEKYKLYGNILFSKIGKCAYSINDNKIFKDETHVGYFFGETFHYVLKKSESNSCLLIEYDFKSKIRNDTTINIPENHSYRIEQEHPFVSMIEMEPEKPKPVEKKKFEVIKTEEVVYDGPLPESWDGNKYVENIRIIREITEIKKL